MNIRESLIANGVGNLREFGYPDCDEKNIFSDMIYSQMFLSMLEENKGMGRDIDAEIDSLIAEIGRQS